MENDLMRSMMVWTFINATFPGGAHKFEEDGGLVSASIRKDEYFIYHPEPPLRWNDEIPQWNHNCDFKLTIVTQANFEGMEKEEVDSSLKKSLLRIFEEVGSRQIVISGNAVLVVFQMIEDCPKEEVTRVSKIIGETVPGLVNAYVQSGSWIEPVQAGAETGETGVLAREIPQRNKVIGEDDITDLKIVLAQCETIDDLINNM